MSYHIFIQNNPELAFLKTKALQAEGKLIHQVFFYSTVLACLKDLAFIKQWNILLPKSGILKICSEGFTKDLLNKHPVPGFTPAGLVNFFAEHARNQGDVLQF